MDNDPLETYQYLVMSTNNVRPDAGENGIAVWGFDMDEALASFVLKYPERVPVSIIRVNDAAFRTPWQIEQQAATTTSYVVTYLRA